MIKIYGFGNALIDIEVSISEKELRTLSIKKGSMVHISSEQQKIWLSQFKSRILSKEPGGSIANSLQAASTQGSTCLFSCSLGKDQENNIFTEGFTESSFEVFHQYSANPTGVCFIFVTPDGERTMASNLSANEDLKPSCLNLEKLSKSDWLLFDAFSVCTINGLKTAKEALGTAKQNKLKIAFGLADINLIQTNLTEIKWVLDQSIDLLFGNEKEINLLNENIKPNCDVLCSYGPNGCRFNQIQVEAEEVSIVNTNGAGDALIGVFLSYLDSLDSEGALREAVDYATKVCLVGGPRL